MITSNETQVKGYGCNFGLDNQSRCQDSPSSEWLCIAEQVEPDRASCCLVK